MGAMVTEYSLELDFSELNRALEQKLNLVAQQLESTLVAETPVRSGYLRSTTYSSVEGMVAEVGQTADYAPYVEYRTGYFTNAVEAAQPALERIWAEK